MSAVPGSKFQVPSMLVTRPAAGRSFRHRTWNLELPNLELNFPTRTSDTSCNHGRTGKHGGGGMSWIRRKLWLLAVAVLPAATTGCHPLTMGFMTPVLVPPWVTERMEQKYAHKNDGRTPIMPPIRAGYPEP